MSSYAGFHPSQPHFVGPPLHPPPAPKPAGAAPTVKHPDLGFKQRQQMRQALIRRLGGGAPAPAQAPDLAGQLATLTAAYPGTRSDVILGPPDYAGQLGGLIGALPPYVPPWVN